MCERPLMKIAFILHKGSQHFNVAAALAFERRTQCPLQFPFVNGNRGDNMTTETSIAARVGAANFDSDYLGLDDGRRDFHR